MIGVGPNHRYFFYRPPTDMRKSFDGLCGLISGLKKDPLSGDVFVFVNRRRTLMKLILWDRNGFLLCSSPFELPPDGEPTWAQMTMMLEGVSLESVKYRRRYRQRRFSC